MNARGWPVTPALNVPPGWDPSNDDVLMCTWKAQGHRPVEPNSMLPACGTALREVYRTAVYRAMANQMDPCRAPQCFPHGYAYEPARTAAVPPEVDVSAPAVGRARVSTR